MKVFLISKFDNQNGDQSDIVIKKEPRNGAPSTQWILHEISPLAHHFDSRD